MSRGKYIKRSLAALGILALFVFVHPSINTHEAAISGLVVDGNGRPVAGARVQRIVEIDSSEWDSVVSTKRVALDPTVTGIDGRFSLPEKREWTWFHSPISYAMPWVHCYGFIEASASGYMPFVSEFGDLELTYRGNSPRLACNGVHFKKRVTLLAVPAT